MQTARQQKMSVEERVGLSEAFENVVHRSGRKRDYAKKVCDVRRAIVYGSLQMRLECFQMLPYQNLISDSLLINLTIDFLTSVGGTAPAIGVVDYVMSIKTSDAALARILVSDLVSRDSRLMINGDDVVLVETDHHSIALCDAGFV